MAKAYSLDLRQKVIDYLGLGHSKAKAARLYNLSWDGEKKEELAVIEKERRGLLKSFPYLLYYGLYFTWIASFLAMTATTGWLRRKHHSSQ